MVPYKKVCKDMQKRATQLKITYFFIKSNAFPLYCSVTLTTSGQKKKKKPATTITSNLFIKH